MSPNQQAFFNEAIVDFMEVDSVVEAYRGTGRRLGATFNGNGCAQCHAQRRLVQQSGMNSKPKSGPQPASRPRQLDGATNTIPSFITRTVRCGGSIHRNPDGFPMAGPRFDIPSWVEATEKDAILRSRTCPELANRNVIFRIPTPVFWLGLVEATPDSTLQGTGLPIGRLSLRSACIESETLCQTMTVASPNGGKFCLWPVQCRTDLSC